VNASVAQATYVDASVELLFIVGIFKALAPMGFFRDEVMERQLNAALTTFTATWRSTHKGNRDGCLTYFALHRCAASGDKML
jgi:hypothetical protein|tara:strand:- start:44 stop:289 length:246 start_codon:yes stop_codon:yes gene_type:complete